MSGKGRVPGATGKALPAVYKKFHMFEFNFEPGEFVTQATTEARAAQLIRGDVAKEALLRGATPVQVMAIVAQQQLELDRQTQSSTRSRLHFADLDLNLPSPKIDTSGLLAGIFNSHDDMLKREYDSLPTNVKRAFVSESDWKQAMKAPKEERASSLDGAGLVGYKRMRPAYYQNGYTDPPDFLSQISPGKVLGFEISGGVHQEFLDRIGGENSGLAKVLNGWSPGLARKTAEEFAQNRKHGAGIGGFEPRLRAVPNPHHKDGTPLLSNHAFGCAIDVDATLNPQIIGKDLIRLLREITGYDFDTQIVPEDSKISNVDRYAQIHLLQSDASKRLQAWLNHYLPLYEEREAETAPPLKPGAKPDSNAIDPSGYTQCKPLDPATAAQVDKVEELVKLRKLGVVRGWAAHGIQNLPLNFVAGMAKVGLKWGSCYGGSKDVMHFELIQQGTDDATFVEPDSPRRPLRALLERWGQAHATNTHHA